MSTTVLDEALAKAITGIPECLAGGYVDIGSGLLLGIRTVDSHPSAVIDLVAAATADLFQGPNVTAVETIFKKARGVENNRHYFQEIIVIPRSRDNPKILGRHDAEIVGDRIA